VEAAHESGRQGYEAHVLVSAGHNHARSEWTYGNDPCPPQNDFTAGNVDNRSNRRRPANEKAASTLNPTSEWTRILVNSSRRILSITTSFHQDLTMRIGQGITPLRQFLKQKAILFR